MDRLVQAPPKVIGAVLNTAANTAFFKKAGAPPEVLHEQALAQLGFELSGLCLLGRCFTAAEVSPH